MNDPQIIVALDFPDTAPALALVDQLDPLTCRLKVGKELFIRGGPQFVESVQAQGFQIFLDLKFHDIPNTVAAACRAAADLDVWMINVHALGGLQMMEAAAAAVASHPNRPLCIGVTVLTSLDTSDLRDIGLTGNPAENVEQLAALAEQAGLDGVVCSASEATHLRRSHNADFKLVTPGIRPAGMDVNDQKRIMTPSQAVAAGASYLVVGRPITRADDPLQVLDAINAELTEQ